MTAQNTPNLPIGMFDSGVGGLTVMRQIQRVLPNESIIYLGDTARLPYGNKSPEAIIRYSLENATFLMDQNIKLLVVACNTATAYALNQLKQICPIPVIGVIEPGAEKAVKSTRNGHIAVLGTKGTIQSGVYQKEIEERLPDAVITAIACPLFVPLAEELFLKHEATRLIIREYLKPLRHLQIDTLLLGCTHYPLLRELIAEELGSSITIVDSAATCAEKVHNCLQTLSLETIDDISSIKYHYFVSDDPLKFQTLGKNFLGMPMDNVESISQNDFAFSH